MRRARHRRCPWQSQVPCVITSYSIHYTKLYEPVPIVVTVTGEGGSGGALALGVGNRVNMLQHAVYSVISPEGCAAILWRDATKNREAASAMKLTAPDLHGLQIVDEIIPEVNGGAHVDPPRQAELIADVLERQLGDLAGRDPRQLVEERYDRFRRLGQFKVIS